ncbi:hypothetical protein TGAMA5MH_10621 [Trichoderma gamsii]|uniref:Uncharacterized protein n=1 Tax=Trichoderma gamsii TaxID=398673 RepID=A0A2K0SW58_9HYPO|nr:hypothetical protein TGAMA5MH_10621 [Trichoderma gamsii]
MMNLLSAPVAAKTNHTALKTSRMAPKTNLMAAIRMVLETSNPRASAPLTPLETSVKAAVVPVACLRR